MKFAVLAILFIPIKCYSQKVKRDTIILINVPDSVIYNRIRGKGIKEGTLYIIPPSVLFKFVNLISDKL